MTRTEAFAQLDELAGLKPGWNSYNAKPPTRAALRTARKLMRRLPESLLRHVVVVPTVRGGIQFEWSLNNHDCELVILADGSLEIEDATYEYGFWWVVFADRARSVSRAATWIPILESFAAPE